MLQYSIIFYILSHYLTAQYICPQQCDTCSSSTQCLTCAQQFYPTTISGTLTCQPCPSYCLICQSADSCIQCIPPYSINADAQISDDICQSCEIPYSKQCSSITSASQCIQEYYVSDNYCLPCLLNCKTCNSHADCQGCIDRYYLNTTVLTCNPCTATNCLQCDQYSPSRCLKCEDGYLLGFTYTCSAYSCNIDKCIFCQGNQICGKCSRGYYWDNLSNICRQSSSILCQGATGVYPNQCIDCSQFFYQLSANSFTNGIENSWCKVYQNIDIEDKRYYQIYYYAQNDESDLQNLFNKQTILSSESNGQKSFLVSPEDKLKFQNLPSFYRITLLIKYRASNDVNLILTATTQQDIQTQEMLLPASDQLTVIELNSMYVHSNNIQIQAQNSEFYLIQLLIRLTKCPDDCYRCLNEEYCEMCHSPQYVSSYKCVDNCTIYYHYVQNRSCLTSCPEGFYPNSQINEESGQQSKYCQPCVEPCEICTSSTRCLTCIAGLFLASDSSCLEICPPTTYPSSTTGKCQTCISPCKQCTSPLECSSCSLGFFDGTDCSNSCPSGTFGNNNTHQCQTCQTPCIQCQNSPNKCTKCQAGKFYYDYGCYSQCLDRYYQDLGTMLCMRCVSPCLQCSSLNDCLSCSYNYLYQNQCISTCPDGYFSNITSKQCILCPIQCQKCQSASICSECVNGSCLFDGSCISQCPQRQYYSFVNNNGLCTCNECSYPCKQCLSANQCLSCLEGYLYQSQCRSICPDLYYADDQTFYCTLCSQKFGDCLQCSIHGCTRCSTLKTLHNGQCLSNCPEYHYQQSQQCHKCIAPCLSCISFTQCISCISPYILLSDGQQNSCLLQCPSNYVNIINIETNTSQCQECTFPCLSCQETTTNCTLCQYGYYLYVEENGIQNICIQNCSKVLPENTYYNQPITSKCTTCMFPCKQCLSQTECLSCRIGYLNGYDCAECDNGFYENQGICVECPSECKTCYNPDFCIACQTDYYLYGFQCISNTSICTSNGYYIIGKTCKPCQMPCQTCQETASNCLSCVSGYIYYPISSSKCITQCPTGTFRQLKECKSCHSYCQTCSNTQTYCFSCKDPYLLILTTMSCQENCPIKHYLEGKICQVCKYPCDDCLSENQCVSCLTGTLVNSTCLTSCPSGEFTNTSFMCQPCSYPCLQCQTSESNCTQCEDGYFLFNDECLSNCPQLYFGQQQAKQCLQCLGLCEQCNSHVNCTTCSGELIYYFNTLKDYAQCVSQCPVSFFAIQVNYQGQNRTECAACLSQCLTCYNDSQCQLCNNNKVQYQGQCYDECPPQMFSSSGICQQCSEPCFNCSDAFTCTACMNDSFLLVGSAQCIIGETCPQGFYRITGTRLCNSQCLQGEYHQNNRTCSTSGCNTDQYLGTDYFCYSKCPDGTIANHQYICLKCEDDQQCLDGLFYQIKWWIQADQLYLGIYFTEEPIYNSEYSSAKFELLGIGNMPFKILDSRRRFLTVGQLKSQQIVSSQSNIMIQLYPEQSFSDFTLQIRFIQALKTFKNPIQRTSKKIYIEGYDKYPSDLVSVSDLQIIIGIFILICAVIGLVRNPYLTDFAQMIYVYGLVNLHYPVNLASFLQSGYLAHLVNFIEMPQPDSYSTGKFGYVTNMGLLSNCFFNILIIIGGLFLFGVIFLLYKYLQKSLNYNKVEDEQNLGLKKDRSQEQQKSVSQSKKFQCFIWLQKNFIQQFFLKFLNRLVYINYLPLIIFTFGQLNVFTINQQNSNSISIASSALSIIMIILLIAYPVLLFIKLPNKAKYSFLILRKLIVGIALILSRQTPEYMVGILAVISLMTGILIKAYGLQKIKLQTKLLMGLQITQFFIAIFMAIFVMIKSGSMTNIRVSLSWVILISIIITLVIYLSFELLCFIVWCYFKRNNESLWERWGLCESIKQDSDAISDSNSNTDSFNSQKKQKGEIGTKTRQIEKKLINNDLNKQIKQEQQQRQKQKKISKDTSNNKFFWTYKESEQDSQADQKSQQNQAPKMLIRCVNEFSDIDSAQQVKQNKQIE